MHLSPCSSVIWTIPLVLVVLTDESNQEQELGASEVDLTYIHQRLALMDTLFVSVFMQVVRRKAG